ncbi:toxin-antitoxin system YwqK family antitoxin [uncultured Polaribacter sp.]|uniref:toxin-antitoxin system YwqK family antitoxin n=1 Tax=uncultured Polaribacter sp. TaxID=174711 RepID=UPI002633D606|nr:toxin-antitoxin system YwqK family antitoxin [uncultured Polaribacter sp.]
MIHIKRLTFFLGFLCCFFIKQDIKAQKINQYNKNNQRIGVWKKYHPNKRIRYTGRFENGKEVGVFKFYDISNSDYPTIIKTFYKNSDSLLVQFFRLNGTLKTEGTLTGRKRRGKWKYFYPDGALMSEEHYNTNGKLHGKQTVYYPDGKITELAAYENGLLHGITKKYASNGSLIEEVTFKSGKENGLAKYFELNGNLKETGNYKEGVRVGEWEYYMDGEVATKKEQKKKFKVKKKN